MQTRPLLFSVIIAIALTSCASYDFSRRIVQQGNLLPHATIARLKIGMSKADAGILMGNSLVSPVFNNDRWDYAYTVRKGNGPLVVRTVSLFFSHGSLARIEEQGT